MTTAKIIKYGDGYALALSKVIANSLKQRIDESIEMDVTEADGDIVITLHGANKRDQLNNSIKRGHQRYAKTFKRLAE